MDPDSDEARMVKFAVRDYEHATRVPSEFIVEQAQVTVMANQAWAEARSKSDFSIFQPHLERIIDLTHRYVGFFPPAEHPYDILLDIYEPDMKSIDVKKIFGELRPKQAALIKAISQKNQVDNSFLNQPFDEKNNGISGSILLHICAISAGNSAGYMICRLLLLLQIEDYYA